MKKFSISIAAVALFIVGCSSENKETPPAADSGPPTVNAPTSATTPTAPAYAAIQEAFTANCTGCHGESNPKGGLNLTSYDAAMKGGTNGPDIVPGDPDKSKLVDALRGRHGVTQMPKGMAALPEETIKAVEDWIRAGAKNS
jgi:mono/diheme cytochrome c family protein